MLFTDIAGSTRLWEQQPQAMRAALAAHDALARQCVAAHQGTLIKTTGDGLHAAFDDPLHALMAVRALLLALADPQATAGLALQVRCGLHAGADEARDNDYFGRDVNRAARIMAVAHGGQVLLSQTVALALGQRLPPDMALRAVGAVRLRDVPRPEPLWQLLAPPLRLDFPALRDQVATPHNLPQPVNHFVGREAELAALRGLLPRHRLLTLVGTGGIGKTRLSLQLGAAVLDDYADGVWRVELAPLDDGERVAAATAAVLGVVAAPGQALVAALCEHLRERQLLLLLDNCEHLLAASAALLKPLLQAAPGLRVLATSREPLHLAGEAVFAVPALTAPAPSAAPPAAELMALDAVRLFVDRARAAQHDWTLADDNAPAVAEVCRRLDGIPLALELAAARVRSVPVALLAQRLIDSFRLVATQDSTVPPRQRTLARLIDWSHDLLQPGEQRLFRRLSVFAGPFTLAAAEAVCADEALPLDDIAEHLAQLVDKSLLVLQRDGGRYRLLDTVRQHAATKLRDSGEAAVHRRHLAHALALAEAARVRLAGPERAQALASLDAEYDNLMAAHAQALALCGAADGQPTSAPLAQDGAVASQALHLCFALRNYWINRGLVGSGLAALQRTLDQPALQAADALRARALFDAGHLYNLSGQPARARQVLLDSVAIMQCLGEPQRLAAIMQPLGLAHAALGEVSEALQCFETAIALARRAGRPLQLAAALVQCAVWHRVHGDVAAAIPMYLEALALAEQHHDDDTLASVHLNLAMVALLRQDTGAAVQALQLALPAARRTGAVLTALSALDVGAVLAAQRGDLATARRWLQHADGWCRRAGLQRDPADEAFVAPWRHHLAAEPPGWPAPAPMDDAVAVALGTLGAWLLNPTR